MSFGMIIGNQNMKKQNLCYMDKDSFIVYIKTNDIYNNTAKNDETRFDTSNYELDRPLPKGKNEKVIQLMKNKLGGKIVIKFVGLRAKSYSYLTDDGSEVKKVKSTKKCIIKRNFTFENYKNSLEATQLDKKKYTVNTVSRKNKIDIDSTKKS